MIAINDSIDAQICAPEIAIYERSIQNHSDNLAFIELRQETFLLNSIGDCYKENNKIDLAISWYEKAGKNITSIKNLIGIYMERGDMVKAESYAQMGLKIKPFDPYCMNIVFGFYIRQDPEKLYKIIKRKIAKDPENLNMIFYLAKFKFYNEMVDVALTYIYIILKKEPNNAYALSLAALAFFVNDKAEGGSFMAKKAYKINPNLEISQEAHAMNLLYLKSMKEALSQANAILKKNPQNELADFIIQRVNM